MVCVWELREGLWELVCSRWFCGECECGRFWVVWGSECGAGRFVVCLWEILSGLGE